MKIELIKDKGITLVALVITIIILLILAGVSINFITGDRSPITQASTVSDRMSNSKVFEELGYHASDYYVVSRLGNYDKEVEDYFLEKGLINHIEGLDDKYIVNINTLIPHSETFGLGKGTDFEHDVYTMTLVDTNDHKFEVIYTDKFGESKLLGTISSREIIVKVEGIGN